MSIHDITSLKPDKQYDAALVVYHRLGQEYDNNIEQISEIWKFVTANFGDRPIDQDFGKGLARKIYNEFERRRDRRKEALDRISRQWPDARDDPYIQKGISYQAYVALVKLLIVFHTWKHAKTAAVRAALYRLRHPLVGRRNTPNITPIDWRNASGYASLILNEEEVADAVLYGLDHLTHGLDESFEPGLDISRAHLPSPLSLASRPSGFVRRDSETTPSESGIVEPGSPMHTSHSDHSLARSGPPTTVGSSHARSGRDSVLEATDTGTQQQIQGTDTEHRHSTRHTNQSYVVASDDEGCSSVCSDAPTVLGGRRCGCQKVSDEIIHRIVSCPKGDDTAAIQLYEVMLADPRRRYCKEHIYNALKKIGLRVNIPRKVALKRLRDTPQRAERGGIKRMKRRRSTCHWFTSESRGPTVRQTRLLQIQQQI